MSAFTLSTLSTACEKLAAGHMIAIHDHDQRENEVDLVIAGQFATAAHLNFMLVEARGCVCSH